MSVSSTRLLTTLRVVGKVEKRATLPNSLVQLFADLKEALTLRSFWEEVAILDAFLKKERRVFHPTPYYAKLLEAIHILREIDGLRLGALTGWFHALTKENSVPCREAFLVFLRRLSTGCSLLERLFPVILKAANKLLALASLGHYPAFVLFSLANIASIREKALKVVEVFVREYNRARALHTLLPVADVSPGVTELTTNLPSEIQCSSTLRRIELKRIWKPFDEESEGHGHVYVMKSLKALQKRPSTERLPQTKRPKTEKSEAQPPKRLSLFDQMQYKQPAAQSTTPPSKTRQQDATWQSWFSEPRPERTNTIAALTGRKVKGRRQ